MTKTRGGKQLLDELKVIRDLVRDAGRTNTDYPTIAKLVEDTGRDLLHIASDLNGLIERLSPMLERIEQRIAPQEIADLEVRLTTQDRRIAALESRVTQLDLERRGVTPFRDVKHERG